MLHGDLDRRVARERDVAGEHLVQHDAQRVEIRAGVDGGAAGLFGREVLRRADDRPGLGHLRRARARDPEVGHLQAAVRADHDVVRLDVAVDDPVAVREGERAQDLARVLDRDGDRRRPVPDEQLLQRSPFEVLHRDVVGPLRVAAVEDRDDVRMVEARGALRLPAEPLDELLVGGMALVQQLQRDIPAQLLVLGEVDVGHPARAELALDHVAPVEDAVDEWVGVGHRRAAYPFDALGRIACMSSFAIGAAIDPPKPFSWCSTTTAPATCGSSAGAKKMNQAS